jgi:kanamycin kinase
MTEPDFSNLGAWHTLGDVAVPRIVADLSQGCPIELVWRNELGGLTFRIGNQFVKWTPPLTGIDLELEWVRLDWLAGRHPVPRVISSGSDDKAQWLVTAALPGGYAVGDTWRARRSEAIAAIAKGLRAIHAVPVDDFPTG